MTPSEISMYRAKVVLAGMCLGLCSVAAAAKYADKPQQKAVENSFYIRDSIQYFAPGPEFKLSREAAAQQAFKEELAGQPIRK